MNNGVSGSRRPTPPSNNDQTLSPRDQLLIRVEALLAEQCLMPFPGQEERDAGEPAELIDVETVIEIAQLPPSVTRPSPAADRQPSAAPPAEPPAQETVPGSATEARAIRVKTSVLTVILQSFMLLFVIVWVFIFGILIGRGHLWESGLGHDLVVWLEDKAGWGQQSEPEVVLMKDASVKSVHQEPILDDHDPTLDDELIELDGSSDSSPADPAGQVNLAQLVQNVILDWSGRQWFAEEAARRRAEARAGLNPGENGEPESGEDGEPAAGSPPGVESPQATAEAAAVGRFAVQVVLAHDEDEAKRRVERLEQQGFIAYYYKNVDGRLPVRVGHFPTREAAGAALARLKSLGYSNPYISSLSD